MHLRTRVLAVSLLAGLATPALAGGLAFDTPTLTWPKPPAPVTQDCLPTAPLGPTAMLACPEQR